MRSKKTPIPVISMSPDFNPGIIISKNSFKGLPDNKDVERPHRDNWHLFILQEKGITTIEIDFQKHVLKPFTLVYIHPSQVHRLIGFKNATIITLQIDEKNLEPRYLKFLEDLNPAGAPNLKADAFSIVAETASLSIKLSKRKHEKLYAQILKESCNTLVALIISQFLKQSTTADKPSRHTAITKSFRSLLESRYSTDKTPAKYASLLNISTPYLNECVRNATGFSVSHHIQQRIILEAERLLYHSDSTVKEIASDLGYEDHSYFTRLFTKVTGMTPSIFRAKNFD